jgi:hypothetical protein
MWRPRSSTATSFVIAMWSQNSPMISSYSWFGFGLVFVGVFFVFSISVWALSRAGYRVSLTTVQQPISTKQSKRKNNKPKPSAVGNRPRRRIIPWLIAAVIVFGAYRVLSPDQPIPQGVSLKRLVFPIATQEELKRERIVGRTVFLTQIPLTPVTSRVTGEVVYKAVNKTFENCEVFGPAIIAPQAVNKIVLFDQNRFDSSTGVESTLLESHGKTIIGCIPMDDCSFIQCKFLNVGFAGSKVMLDKFRAGAVER